MKRGCNGRIKWSRIGYQGQRRIGPLLKEGGRKERGGVAQRQLNCAIDQHEVLVGKRARFSWDCDGELKCLKYRVDSYKLRCGLTYCPAGQRISELCFLPRPESDEGFVQAPSRHDVAMVLRGSGKISPPVHK
jgi:hypothetical protein